MGSNNLELLLSIILAALGLATKLVDLYVQKRRRKFRGNRRSEADRADSEHGGER